MAEVRIVLSDGKPCDIKKLGLFDLDGVGPTMVGPFTYTYTLANGQEVVDSYDIHVITTPPSHPGVPENEIVPHTPQWYALLEWQTYRAAVSHEYKRQDSVATHILEVSKFIVDHCVPIGDISRIQTDEDWDTVYRAAIVPEVTFELLQQVMKDTFAASFDGKELFNAMQSTAKGSGTYDALRVWEIEAMYKFGYKTEAEWIMLPLSERVRKVAGIVLPRLMANLEEDKQMKEARAEAKKGKK